MKFLSICSGIEAASVAWHPLGWNPVAFAEIEPFPCALLDHRYPQVPNWGDITKFKSWPHEPIDILVGGPPCQSFSLAGLRGGLDDPRGNLTLTYLAIAKQYRPAWTVYENVPGLLSVDGGRTFGRFLSGLGQLGYGVAYRVLDSQFVRVDGFGRAVPQRRRRVFVVGYLGDWRRSAAVLFDRESFAGNSPPSRSAGEGFTHDVAPCIGASGRGFDRNGETRGQDPVVAAPLTSNPYGDHESRESLLVAHSLRGEGFDASEDGTGRGTPLIAFPARMSATQCASAEDVSCTIASNPTAIAFQTRIARNGRGNMGDAVNALQAQSGENGTGDAAPCVASKSGVRRLTPRECERLMGFPDDHTFIPYSGRLAKDGPRYRAIGNSMAVNCMRWIGRRIQMMESIQSTKKPAAPNETAG